MAVGTIEHTILGVLWMMNGSLVLQMYSPLNKLTAHNSLELNRILAPMHLINISERNQTDSNINTMQLPIA